MISVGGGETFLRHVYLFAHQQLIRRSGSSIGILFSFAPIFGIGFMCVLALFLLRFSALEAALNICMNGTQVVAVKLPHIDGHKLAPLSSSLALLP